MESSSLVRHVAFPGVSRTSTYAGGPGRRKVEEAHFPYQLRANAAVTTIRIFLAAECFWTQLIFLFYSVRSCEFTLPSLVPISLPIMETALPSVLQTGTLDPLPDVLHQGLAAVAFFGSLSLLSSLGLFVYLTFRLISWYVRGQLKDGANQFLLLIYNLLLADIQQAMAFALSAVHLARNKIEVGSTVCFANGWFVSTGDLASGVFIFSIALHTFFAVVKGRKLSNRVFYAWIVGAWVSVLDS